MTSSLKITLVRSQKKYTILQFASVNLIIFPRKYYDWFPTMSDVQGQEKANGTRQAPNISRLLKCSILFTEFL